MARLWVAASLVLALPFLLGVAECGYDCDSSPEPPEGSQSDLTLAGLEGAGYSVSTVETCSADDPIYRVVISGKGSQPLYDTRDPEAAYTWFEDHVLTRLDDTGVYWGSVWSEGHGCNGSQLGIAISAWSWEIANEIAKIIAMELAADDRYGEIGVLLENVSDCPA